MNDHDLVQELRLTLALYLEKNRNSLPEEQLNEIEKALQLIDEICWSHAVSYRQALISEILLSLLRVMARPQVVKMLEHFFDSLHV